MYRATLDPTIVLTSDGRSVPMDPTNPEWRRCLKWLAAGNTLAPAESLEESKARRRGAIEQQAAAQVKTILEVKRAAFMAFDFVRAIVALDKKAEGETLTAGEDNLLTKIRTKQSEIDAVRQSVVAAFQAINAATTPAEVAAVTL